MTTKFYFLFFISSLLLTSCSQSDSLNLDEEPQVSLRISAQMTKFTYDYDTQSISSGGGSESSIKWWTEVWLDKNKNRITNVSGGIVTTSKNGITNQALADYFWNANVDKGGKHTISTSYTNPITKKKEELEYELDPTTGVLKPKKKLTEMGIND